jgi:anaerobic selenocysteine-containing dehydrogenase
VKALLLHEANPVYGSPSAWRVRETLSKIPFIASFGNFIDETSILADLILPDHSFLESAVDHIPESGASVAVTSTAPAVMSPLHQTRATTDVLLEVARRMELKGRTPQLRELRGPSLQLGAELRGPSLKFPSVVEAQFDGDSAKFPLHFLPYKSQAFLDGSLAHLPWLQEMPDVLSTAMWSSWLEMHPETAKSLGLSQGDTAEVESGHGKLQAPVLISPGIAPNIVAMPMGQGHETFTRYASGRGANPISILAPVSEPETGSLAWAATRVKVSKAAGNEKLILFAGETREHANEHR